MCLLVGITWNRVVLLSTMEASLTQGRLHSMVTDLESLGNEEALTKEPFQVLVSKVAQKAMKMKQQFLGARKICVGIMVQSNCGRS